MGRRAAIVVTTIFEPAFLSGYVENLRAYGRAGDTTIFVIPDRKTPPSVGEACTGFRKQGAEVRCPDLDAQEAFLRRLGLPDGFIPFNSDNRRNVGFLMALEAGCDVLISIDDDNLCPSKADFVGEHLVAGSDATAPEVSTSDGWFNLCSMLDLGGKEAIFPRGFPYAARGTCRTVSPGPVVRRPVAVNVGLWREDPDVDAVARLVLAPRARGMVGEPVLLAPGVWTPINTQNTAVAREAVPAYYYVRMGHPLHGLAIDRYGDILSGYFVQKCAEHLGQSMRVGGPVADHVRTPHNLFKDLYHELAGMVLIEDLLPWLREAPLSGGGFAAAYADLAERLEAAAPRFRGFIWDDGGRDFLVATAKRMRTWLHAVARVC